MLRWSGESRQQAAGPTTATGPLHNTRYILLLRAVSVLSHSSTHSTHCAAQHPPRGGDTRSYSTMGNTRHNRHPCAPCMAAKGTQHVQQRQEAEGRVFVLRSPKEGLSAGTWRRKVLCAPVGETTPQVAIPGSSSRRWGEVPHRQLRMAAWTHLANGEGICLPLHGLDAEK